LPLISGTRTAGITNTNSPATSPYRIPISRPIFLPTRCATSASTNSIFFSNLVESLLDLEELGVCTCCSDFLSTGSFLDLYDDRIASDRTRVPGLEFVDLSLNDVQVFGLHDVDDLCLLLEALDVFDLGIRFNPINLFGCQNWAAALYRLGWRTTEDEKKPPARVQHVRVVGMTAH
jgi:hypothetical protein